MYENENNQNLIKMSMKIIIITLIIICMLKMIFFLQIKEFIHGIGWRASHKKYCDNIKHKYI